MIVPILIVIVMILALVLLHYKDNKLAIALTYSIVAVSLIVIAAAFLREARGVF